MEANKKSGISTRERKQPEKRRENDIGSRSQFGQTNTRERFGQSAVKTETGAAGLTAPKPVTASDVKGGIKRNVQLTHSPIQQGKYSLKGASETPRQKQPLSSAPTGRGSEKIVSSEEKTTEQKQSENLQVSAKKPVTKISKESSYSNRKPEETTRTETYKSESVEFSHSKNANSTAENTEQLNKAAEMLHAQKDNYIKYTMYNGIAKERSFSFIGAEARRRKADREIYNRSNSERINEFGKKVTQATKAIESTIARDGEYGLDDAAKDTSAAFAFRAYSITKQAAQTQTQRTSGFENLKNKLKKQNTSLANAQEYYQNTFEQYEITRFKLESDSIPFGETEDSLRKSLIQQSSQVKTALGQLRQKEMRAKATANLLKKKQDTFRKSNFVKESAKTTGLQSVSKVYRAAQAVKSIGSIAVPNDTPLIAILAGAIFMIIISVIVSLVIVIGAVLYPFTVVFEYVDGIFNPMPVKSQGESINYYLNLEKDYVSEEQAELDAALSYSGGGSAPVKPGMERALSAAAILDMVNQSSYQEAYDNGWDYYFYTDPITGAYGEASVDSGAPVFDDSSYRMETFLPDANGNIYLTPEQAAQYALEGSNSGGGGGGGGSGKPYVPPIYEGVRWKGTPPRSPFNRDWDSSEGDTDAESISPPDEIYLDMLATFASDRQFKNGDEMTMYIEPNELKSFFNSLPLWEWAAWKETYYDEGCITIHWIETVTTYTYDEHGNVTGSSTEEVPMEELICPGHIYSVGDVQLDTDSIENIPSEYYNMDRVWDNIWGTPHLGESGEVLETQAEADKRRKDGVKAQKDVKKQMKKDLKDYEFESETSE
jgi:hypothetical protein